MMHLQAIDQNCDEATCFLIGYNDYEKDHQEEQTIASFLKRGRPRPDILLLESWNGPYIPGSSPFGSIGKTIDELAMNGLKVLYDDHPDSLEQCLEKKQSYSRLLDKDPGSAKARQACIEYWDTLETTLHKRDEYMAREIAKHVNLDRIVYQIVGSTHIFRGTITQQLNSNGVPYTALLVTRNS